jgi:hypothetical protein
MKSGDIWRETSESCEPPCNKVELNQAQAVTLIGPADTASPSLHSKAVRLRPYFMSGGGARFGARRCHIALPVLAGEHRAATFTSVGCRRGKPR